MKVVFWVLSVFMLAGGHLTLAHAQVTVKDSVDRTLQYHKQLKSIQENRQAAMHDVRRQQSGWLPRLDAVGRAGGSYGSDTASRALNNDKQMWRKGTIGATLSQTLWDGLATKDRVNMAKLQLRSMDYRVVDNATSLALDAIIAHATVTLNREILGYAHQNVEQHLNILAAQKERSNTGASTVADVSQIQGRLARARSQLADAQGNLLQAEEDYLRLTGVQAPPEMEKISLPLVMFGTPESCYDAAQRSNPKLLAYFEDSKKARVEQSLATAAYQPTLNAEVSAGATDQDGNSSGRHGNWTNYTDAMLVMRWNLFNGGGDLASERVAAARYRQAREDAYNLSDSLKQQIFNMFTSLKTAQDMQKNYAEAMDYNERTRAGFMEQFLIGQRSLLDVLDTSSELFNSSIQWATARTNAHVAAYTMSALAGDLLDTFSIDRKNLLVSTAQ